MIRRRCPTSGFTLVELLVVVLILSIVSVTVVAELGNSRSAELARAAAREFAAMARLARSQAVTTGREHRIRVDSGEHRFSIEARRERRTEVASETAFVPLRDVPGASRRFDERLSIRVEKTSSPRSAGSVSLARDQIAFAPDGTAERCEIEISDGLGTTIELRIHPVTAQISIADSTSGGK